MTSLADLTYLASNLEWNVRHREVLCNRKYNLEVVSIFRYLLGINNDGVVRETICCINELYDETTIFSGTKEIDDVDVRLRTGLLEFLSNGL